MKVLAFDIGIKNLAWALLDRKEGQSPILGLANDNIMLAEVGVEEETLKCAACRNKATWQAGTRHVCKRHIPETYQELPGNPTKIPGIAELRKSMLAEELQEFRKAGSKRAAALEILSKRFVFPIPKPKKVKAGSLGPEQLHDGIRAFVARRWEFFHQADQVLLENQPAFKNPHMKTVQILLFSCLREEFFRRSGSSVPPFHFVHAKKKVEGAPKGDEGYAERKAKSEERVSGLYRDGIIVGGESVWSEAKKKSDMADAICMCCDFTV